MPEAANELNIGWIIGHKDILAFMKKTFNQKSFSWKTVRRWRDAGMPFHRLWNGKPYIIPEEVIKWQLKRTKI